MTGNYVHVENTATIIPSDSARENTEIADGCPPKNYG